MIFESYFEAVAKSAVKKKKKRLEILNRRSPSKRPKISTFNFFKTDTFHLLHERPPPGLWLHKNEIFRNAFAWRNTSLGDDVVLSQLDDKLITRSWCVPTRSPPGHPRVTPGSLVNVNFQNWCKTFF